MEVSEIDEIQIFDLDTHSARYVIGKGMVVASDMKGVPNFRKITGHSAESPRFQSWDECV